MYLDAMVDAMAIYREIVKSTDPRRVAIFGTSTGGGMTLAMVLRAKREGLPLPAAIAPGTPWTDMTKTGDSYFSNERIDNCWSATTAGWATRPSCMPMAMLKDPQFAHLWDVTGFRAPF